MIAENSVWKVSVLWNSCYSKYKKQSDDVQKSLVTNYGVVK